MISSKFFNLSETGGPSCNRQIVVNTMNPNPSAILGYKVAFLWAAVNFSQLKRVSQPVAPFHSGHFEITGLHTALYCFICPPALLPSDLPEERLYLLTNSISTAGSRDYHLIALSVNGVSDSGCVSSLAFLAWYLLYHEFSVSIVRMKVPEDQDYSFCISES